MKIKKIKDYSLQVKMSLIFIFANVLIFVVNLIMYNSINDMNSDMDKVFNENIKLNELSIAISDVHNNMTEYLNTKTSDAMEEYYKSVQEFNSSIQELPEVVGSTYLSRMERNIKNLSLNYIAQTDQTVEAKRGRNVQKYSMRYQKASELYDYINTFIESLNNDQLISNSQNYQELSKSLRLLETVNMTLLLITVFGTLIIITALTGSIISPLKKLSHAANRVANGELEIERLDVESKDEIGVVTSAFNQMVISIRDNIEKLKDSMESEQMLREKELKMETHLKDAQLKYLQAQINPHFLFNTLNAGAQLAMMEDADKTYTYVQKVANFFRYNVKKNNDIVTIKEEIELVNDYIYILNVRFSGDIHFEKRIDPNVLFNRMPSMILQPIIENSVNHGIREMEGKGVIILSVYRKRDSVYISIMDNGVGMEPEKIDRLLNGNLQETDMTGNSNGVGMDNVIQRLRLYSGMDDVIDIHPGKDGIGLEVVLRIQIEEGDK